MATVPDRSLGKGASPQDSTDGKPIRATILLAEDEQSIRHLLATYLRATGYTVLEASNGQEASTLCAEKALIINLLITDFGMPLLNGRDLIERVAPLRPAMRIILMTGRDEQTSHQMPGVEMLAKPFRLEAVFSMVRRILK
jgi:DNA-binding response OmpR family regulator